MTTTHTSSFLRAGSKFRGTQQSDRQKYAVEVDIKSVNMAESEICGYLRIEGQYDTSELLESLTNQYLQVSRASTRHWRPFSKARLSGQNTLFKRATSHGEQPTRPICSIGAVSPLGDHWPSKPRNLTSTTRTAPNGKTSSCAGKNHSWSRITAYARFRARVLRDSIIFASTRWRGKSAGSTFMRAARSK